MKRQENKHKAKKNKTELTGDELQNRIDRKLARMDVLLKNVGF